MAQIHTAQLRRMDALLKRPENRECFDCNSKQPRWASTNLGIFVCLRCAGVHRGIGVHITKVKSTNMDAWEEKMIDCVDRIGNANGKLLYEARVPPGYKKLDQLCDNVTLERTIRQKYETRQFWAPNYDELYAQMMATPSTQTPSLIPISSQPSLTSLTTPATPPPSVSNFGGSSVPATTGGNGIILQGRVVSSSNNNININNGAANNTTNTSGNANKKPITSSAVDDLWGDFTSTPSATPLASQIVSPPSTAAAAGAGTFQQQQQQSRFTYQNTNNITSTCNAMTTNQRYRPSFMPEPSVVAANNFEEDFFGMGANQKSKTIAAAGRGPAAPGVDFFTGGAGALASPTGTFCSVATQRGSPVPSSSSRQNTTSTLNDDFFSAGDWGNAAGSSPRSAVVSQSSSPAALTSNNNTNGPNFGMPSNNTNYLQNSKQQQQQTPTNTHNNNNIITVEADYFFSGGFPTGGGVLPTSSSGMSSPNTSVRPTQQQKQQQGNNGTIMGIADDFFGGGVKSPSSFASPSTVPPPPSSSSVPSTADERIALTLAALDRSRNVSVMGRPQPQQREGGTIGQLSNNGPVAVARQW